MNRKILNAVVIFTSSAIGAGILSIPYLIIHSGFWTGMMDIVLIGLIMLIINLCCGEIILRTRKSHQLAGYAGRYLGIWGKRLMMFSIVFGIYGALLAYLIGAGASLSVLFGLTPFVWSMIFFVIGSAILFSGFKVLELAEDWLSLAKLAIFILLIGLAFGSTSFSASNLTGFSFSLLLVPYGIIVFSYLNTIMIPEMAVELKSQKHNLRKAIIISSLVPIAAYALFAIAAIGLSGTSTPQIATIAMARMLSSNGFWLASLFALLNLCTPFISLGFALKDTYMRDLRIKKTHSWLLVIVIPALLYLAGLQSFERILEITGAVSGGIAAILLLVMYEKAKKHSERKPEYALNLPSWSIWLLVAMFVFAGIYAIFA